MKKTDSDTQKVNRNKRIRFIIFILVSLSLVPMIYIIGKYMDSRNIKHQTELNLNTDEYKYVIDFESNRYLTNTSAISSDRFLSGSKSGKLYGYKAYSPSINIAVPTDDTTDVDGLNINFWLNPESEDVNITLVFSVLDQNKNQIHWDGYNIKREDLLADNWQVFQHQFNFPADLVSTRNTMKIYFWNQKDYDKAVYIDDITISMNENTSQNSPRSKFIDFENCESKKISSKYSLSGFYSTIAAGVDAFSYAIKIPMKEIKYENMHSIAYSFHYLCEEPVVDAAFVLSITDSSGNDVLWQSTHLSFENHETGVWEIGNGNSIIPKEAIDSTNTIKIYLWNRNENTIYIDDVYLVIKENSGDGKDVEPAADLLKNQEFEKKSNHPPYDFKYVKKVVISDDNIEELLKVFTKSKKTLVGNFIEDNKGDEILAIYKTGAVMIDFKDNEIIVSEPKFVPELQGNYSVFADDEYLAVCNIDDNNIFLFEYIDSKFEKNFEINDVDATKVAGFSCNKDKSFSIFYNNGSVETYKDSNSNFTKIKDQYLFQQEFGNVKIIKGNILGNNNQVLFIFKQNGIDKYQIFDYNASTSSWSLSDLHVNKSSQGHDRLLFNNDYYLCKYDQDGHFKTLSFSKSKKFELRLLEFNKMSYEILYNIDFVGYPGKQNPKYYEVNKLICGDFVGDERTEIIIFQDNLHKVDWLSQKVEIYSFE